MQSLEDCSKHIQQWTRIEGTYPLDPSRCKVNMPWNVQFIEEVSTDAAPPHMRKEVLQSLKHGFKSGYPGHGYFQRDFAGSLKDEDTKLAFAAMDKEMAKGHVIGPFKQCPFPNPWCNKQAVICQLFFRDKHKWVHDGQKRLIGNKSFPLGRSFNDLVPRRDTSHFIDGYTYFTFNKLVESVRQVGPNCLLASFDVKDAYKNCRMATSEIWQQVYRIADTYYIDLGGTFGSRNAGDAWNITMELIRSARAIQARTPRLLC